MRTFAYTTPSQRWAVTRAAGVDPLTSPPITTDDFSTRLLTHHDLLYFSLHGLPNQPTWYGDHNTPALSTHAFTGPDGEPLDLSRAIVFVATCYFTDSPFLPAILACRPRALIAGTGPNYARGETLTGAHLLGYYLRQALDLHLPPAFALATAKRRITLLNTRLHLHIDHHNARLQEDIQANIDALAFEVLT
jgi:hypothetical protein